MAYGAKYMILSSKIVITPDYCVLEPLHHHELLQLQEVLFVGGILHLPLIVDVSQK